MATILFADDEPWLLNSFIHRLSVDRHQVIEAESAEEALDALKKQPVHLLVLDIMMPYESLETMLRKGAEAVVNSLAGDVWTGIRLYEEVRRLYPNLKIAVLSVVPEGEIRAEAEGHNINMTQCVFLRKGGVDGAGNLDKIYSMLPPPNRTMTSE